MREVNNQSVLADVRVLDLTHVVAGPYASMYLAMLGAEIIKIENPKTGGDICRFTGPFVNDFSARFCTLNHNKSSVVIDLAQEEGRKLFLDLVACADIVLENFRPGVMDKLGIGYETLRSVNPKIVCGSISGFGSWGPYRDLPAYDVIAQAMSGIMWLNGREEDPPMKVGTSIGDIIAGVNLLVGVLAALWDAQRTGIGRHVEVSLVDSLVASLLTDQVGYLLDGSVPERVGNNYREWCPYGAYPAKDGYFVIGVGTNAFFQTLVKEILHRPEMAEDPKFSGQDDRIKNRQEIDEVLKVWAAEQTVEQICEQLRQKGIPCAPVNSIRETVSDPHIANARNMFPSYLQPQIGEVRVTNMPIRFRETEEVPLAAAPGLGEQTAEVLKRLLAMTEDEINVLQKHGIVSG